MLKRDFAEILAGHEWGTLQVPGDRILMASHLERVWRWSATGKIGVGFTNVTNFVVESSTAIDVDRLNQALRRLCSRHPLLNCRVVECEGRLAFECLEAPVVSVYASSSLDSREILQLLGEAVWLPFGDSDSLFRLFSVDCGGKGYLGFVLHHLIGDPDAVIALGRELLDLYLGVTDVWRTDALHTFADYSLCLEKWTKTPSGHRAVTYWRDAVRDVAMAIPRQEPAAENIIITSPTEEIAFELDRYVVDRVMTVARSSGVTPFSVLLSAYCIAWARGFGMSDICIICLHSLRNVLPTTAVVGNYSDVLPIRLKVGDNDNIVTLAKRVLRTWGEIMRKFALCPDKLSLLSSTDASFLLPRFNFLSCVADAQSASRSEATESLRQVIIPFRAQEDGIGSEFSSPYFVISLFSRSITGRFVFCPGLFDGSKMEAVVTNFIGLLSSANEVG